MRSIKPAATAAMLIAVMITGGCAPLQPWERGNLAKPQMALDPYPLQSALRAHNYGSREAAAGGQCGARRWLLLARKGTLCIPRINAWRT